MSNSNQRRRVSQRSLSSCAASISNWLPERGEATLEEVKNRLGTKRVNAGRRNKFRDLMVDRGLIEIHAKRTGQRGPATEVWVWVGGDRRIGRYDPPRPGPRSSHAECDHPSTHRAREECREQRARDAS